MNECIPSITLTWQALGFGVPLSSLLEPQKSQSRPDTGIGSSRFQHESPYKHFKVVPPHSAGDGSHRWESRLRVFRVSGSQYPCFVFRPMGFRLFGFRVSVFRLFGFRVSVVRISGMRVSGVRECVFPEVGFRP